MRSWWLAVSPVILVLAGCATTHDPGWEGSGAELFDGARAACERESRAAATDRVAREAMFETCMAARGWRRPAP